MPLVVPFLTLGELRRVSHSYPSVIRIRYVDENHEISQSILGDIMYFCLCPGLFLKTYIETMHNIHLLSSLSFPFRFRYQRTPRGIEKQRAREFPYNGGEGERQFVYVGVFNRLYRDVLTIYSPVFHRCKNWVVFP